MTSEATVNAFTNWTAAQMLLSVKHAIMSILLGGQATLINGRNVSRADLEGLREFKKELEAEITSAAGYDGFVYIETDETS
jgi:glucose uptake protein GlcU